MILRIDRDTRLKDIQAGFSDAFAFLRLEFFRNPHKVYKASPKKDMRSPEERALAADRTHTVAVIPINSTLRVTDVEEALSREAGLYAQVLRRSGNVWIETSLTDDWTLEQQNREGEQLSTFIPVNPDSPASIS